MGKKSNNTNSSNTKYKIVRLLEPNYNILKDIANEQGCTISKAITVLKVRGEQGTSLATSYKTQLEQAEQTIAILNAKLEQANASLRYYSTVSPQPTTVTTAPTTVTTAPTPIPATPTPVPPNTPLYDTAITVQPQPTQPQQEMVPLVQPDEVDPNPWADKSRWLAMETEDWYLPTSVKDPDAGPVPPQTNAELWRLHDGLKIKKKLDKDMGFAPQTATLADVRAAFAKEFSRILFREGSMPMQLIFEFHRQYPGNQANQNKGAVEWGEKIFDGFSSKDEEFSLEAFTAPNMWHKLSAHYFNEWETIPKCTVMYFVQKWIEMIWDSHVVEEMEEDAKAREYDFTFEKSYYVRQATGALMDVYKLATNTTRLEVYKRWQNQPLNPLPYPIPAPKSYYELTGAADLLKTL